MRYGLSQEMIDDQGDFPITPLLGPLIYKIGANKTLQLCKQRILDCPLESPVHKFIQTFQLFEYTNPILSFDHAINCYWVLNNESRPFGFRSKKECLGMFDELRNFVGLEVFDLKKEKMAVNHKFGFRDALKCRWSRQLADIPMSNLELWLNTLTNCVKNIEDHRVLLGLEAFNNVENNVLFEPRYTAPPTIEASTAYPNWNPSLFEQDETGNYHHLKTYLDHHGSVDVKYS